MRKTQKFKVSKGAQQGNCLHRARAPIAATTGYNKQAKDLQVGKRVSEGNKTA